MKFVHLRGHPRIDLLNYQCFAVGNRPAQGKETVKFKVFNVLTEFA